jgi:hypothetical protein
MAVMENIKKIIIMLIDEKQPYEVVTLDAARV